MFYYVDLIRNFSLCVFVCVWYTLYAQVHINIYVAATNCVCVHFFLCVYFILVGFFKLDSSRLCNLRTSFFYNIYCLYGDREKNGFLDAYIYTECAQRVFVVLASGRCGIFFVGCWRIYNGQTRRDSYRITAWFLACGLAIA